MYSGRPRPSARAVAERAFCDALAAGFSERPRHGRLTILHGPRAILFLDSSAVLLSLSPSSLVVRHAQGSRGGYLALFHLVVADLEERLTAPVAANLDAWIDSTSTPSRLPSGLAPVW